MSSTTSSTPAAVSMTNVSLPPLHTLNLLPDRIAPPCIPQLYTMPSADDSTYRAPFQHVRRARSSSSSSSSSASYPSTPSLSPSSRTSSRSSSPALSVRLVPSTAEDANALLWLPAADARASAVLLTGAAVSKHLRALERERGRARPYRVVFDRRMSTSDAAPLPLRRLRAPSEESN